MLRLLLAALLAGGAAACGDHSPTPSSGPTTAPAEACGGGNTGRCIVVAPSSKDRETILAALIDAQPGDVIVLKAGHYRVDGQLSLEVDGVTVRGEGMDRTVLSFTGQRVGGEGFLVTANHFTLEDVGLEDGPGDLLKVLGGDGLTVRRVRAEWTRGASAANGAYGIEPVQCRNVLIEDSVARGAAAAGIYVGQSKSIVVRRNRVESNVSGIEIENSQDADVTENVATDNAAGILVFDVPGVPIRDGRRSRVFSNQVFANNTQNFAPPGNIVGGVPTGTGIMVMANDQVEVFDNQLHDNGSGGVLVFGFHTAQRIGGYQANDTLYDPFCEGILVAGNSFNGDGSHPDERVAPSIRQLLRLPEGAPLPQVLVDGDVDPKKLVGGALPAAKRTCIDQPAASFGDLDLAHGSAHATTDPSAYACTMARLPAIDAVGSGVVLADLPADLPSPVALPGSGAEKENRCSPAAGAAVSLDPTDLTCNLLSSYRLFKGDGSTQEPNDGVVPYDVNTQLFADEAVKHRFVYVPPGGAATYDESNAFSFPVGSVLVKTFVYPRDARDSAAGERLLETRLLIHRPDRWIGVTYVWNDAQTEAVLRLTGTTIPASWIDASGAERSNPFNVPNANQCKECHEAVQGVMSPLGPKARNLNKDFAYPDGAENQIAHWMRAGILSGAPDPASAPHAAVFDDPRSGTLEERARTYLDVNCSNCHNPQGLARTSGLYLTIFEDDPTALGICKTPVAAGGGSGNLRFDVQPGSPENSILLYRMQSTEPGVAMPELGRQLAHQAAIELLSDWIRSLPGSCN